ncbi:MAG: endonuclease/exonuclease/phosphatase family protein [Gammaproteobacteria bacterium]
MRFNPHYPGLFISLMLATVASIAGQQGLQDIKPLAVNHVDGNCRLDRLVQNTDAVAQQAPGLDPESITILNWNIYKGKRDGWATDFKRYSQKHDILTIQEAHLGDELESLLEDEHHHWTMNVAFNYQDKATGVMTASAIKPDYLCGQRTIEPLIRTPKTSLIAYYPLAGVYEHLLVANIHGINFTLGLKAYHQQIEKLYSIIKHHDGPVVLAGDFNTWSDARMRIVEALAQRLALASLDYTNHNRTNVFGNAIDHVFYRGLEPVEHDTWRVTSSDHNPTRVSFRVKSYYLTGDGMAERVIDENNC